MAPATPHIAILPTPGMGHLIPLVQFAKKLVHRHRISATFIIPTDGPLSAAQKDFLSAVDYLTLPAVSFDDMPPDVRIETLICLTITRSLPSIRAAVKSMLDGGKRVVAFVVDLFGADGLEVAAEFGIRPYIFFPSTAMALSVILHLPELDKTVSCEYGEVPDKLQIPGCMPIHGRDLIDALQERQNDAYKWFLHQAKKYRMFDGIILNSFRELEPGPVEYLQEKRGNEKLIVYPIGPLIETGSKSDENLCLKWLDDQPSGSVLYVSFGSGGTLSHDQMVELALGLEMSEQRFLWVVRCPSEEASSATYFSVEKDEKDPLAYLPQGFLDRTRGRGRGLVVPLWAPQARILAHRSTSAFLTHCGWNSTLESVVGGVPLIAWPLYAEQKMNAVMLHEDIKVALRPKVDGNGLVGRVEIANVIKGLMEGEEGKKIRSRMRELKDAATEVLSEKGSSTKSLDELANKWISNLAHN